MYKCIKHNDFYRSYADCRIRHFLVFSARLSNAVIKQLKGIEMPETKYINKIDENNSHFFKRRACLDTSWT